MCWSHFELYYATSDGDYFLINMEIKQETIVPCKNPTRPLYVLFFV
jgi:hypothetical protein